MRTMILIIFAALSFTAPQLQAQEHQVAVDVDLVSRYIWRGFERSAPQNNEPALQPGLTYTHGETGLWARAWFSTMLTSRDEIAEPNELDLTFGWNRFINDRFGVTAGYNQYFYPGNNVGDAFGYKAHSEELFAGILTNNMYINPYGTLFIDFGRLDGIYLLMGAGFPIGRQLTVPLTLDVSMGLMSYDVVEDFGGNNKSGVSDLNIGVSTSIGNEKIYFKPALVWTISGMDEVNEDDEIWIRLGVSFGN